MSYIAGVAVDGPAPLPEGMVSRGIAGGRYAALTHRGPLSGITGSIDYLFREWISASSWVIDDREGIECYDERFAMEAPRSEFDIMAPIRER